MYVFFLIFMFYVFVLFVGIAVGDNGIAFRTFDGIVKEGGVVLSLIFV